MVVPCKTCVLVPQTVCVIPHRGPLSVGQAGWQVGGVDNAVPAPVCPGRQSRVLQAEVGAEETRSEENA